MTFYFSVYNLYCSISTGIDESVKHRGMIPGHQNESILVQKNPIQLNF